MQSQASKTAIEQERIAAQERIAGLQTGAKVQSDKLHIQSDEQIEGMRLGVEIKKHQANLMHNMLKGGNQWQH